MVDTAPSDAGPSDDENAVAPARFGRVLSQAGLIAWSIVGILAVLWAMIWLLGRLEVLIAPVVVAVVVVYLLNPAVNRFARMGIPRIMGALLAYVILIGLLVLAAFLILPSISDQATTLANDFPEDYEKSAAEIEGIIANLGFGDVDLWSYDELQEFIQDPERQDAVLSTLLDNIGQVTSGILEAILVFFVAPVVAFYIVIDLPRVRREAIELIPLNLRDEVIHVARQLGWAVGGFLRGQVLVALIVGLLMSVGFAAIGLRFWLIIGMIAGFFNIVPFVGPWVGGFLGVIVGLTDDVQTAILAGVVALVVQQIDNNFVSPTVLRATVRLHPAVVLLVLILGGAVGGLWGVLLAVPVTAAAKILVGHLWRTRVLGQSWEEASEAMVTETEPSLARLRRQAEALDTAADEADAAAHVSENGEPDEGPGSLNG